MPEPRKNRVFVVGAYPEYIKMFEKWGWESVDSMTEADLIQFTGGSDVSPELYGESTHYTTCTYPERDHREILIFEWAKKHEKDMAGICRGGQFLNVMSGGKLFQNVDGHLGNHEAKDVRTGEVFTVTSTHHQMMRPGNKGLVVLTASEATTKMHCGPPGGNVTYKYRAGSDPDIEAVWYAHTKCFCFQPHPEFIGAPAQLSEIYMDYLEEFFGYTIPNLK